MRRERQGKIDMVSKDCFVTKQFEVKRFAIHRCTQQIPEWHSMAAQLLASI